MTTAPTATDRPYLLGVTGNIASGKSSVSAILAELGATVIDSDQVYHELIALGSPLLDQLRQRFGDGVIAADGTLDRRALGGVVFSDPAALADLDRITHPPVLVEVRRRVASLGDGVVVLDAVKLIESGHADDCDQVWVVTATPAQQVARLVQRNKLSQADAERRVAAQPALAAKLAKADVVIDNSGSPAATRTQVLRAWAELPIHDPTEGTHTRGRTNQS